MTTYKGFRCDQYDSVYDSCGLFVGKLNGETLAEWVDDFFRGLENGLYEE